MLKVIAKSVLRPFWTPVRFRMEQYVEGKAAIQTARIDSTDRVLAAQVERLERLEHAERELAAQLELVESEASALRTQRIEIQHQFDILAAEVKHSRYSTFSPDPTHDQIDASLPAFKFSNCQAEDFYHPRYIQMCKLIGERPRFHRKQWEWAFVLHKLLESGAVVAGARGLAFGVGREPLPAVFASMGVDVTATDAPLELATTASWTTTNQHSSALAGLSYPEITPDDRLAKHVTHGYCNMADIGPEFSGYDFNWSSCCFEHLGSLEAGMDFVVNAVEKTLKIGGVAVHTTEFNASSNEDTIETGETVMYRRRDMEALVQRLRDRGHEVEDFKIGPMAHALDFHVDVPPYTGNVHLKLRLAGYACTSVGLVIRRGR